MLSTVSYIVPIADHRVGSALINLASVKMSKVLHIIVEKASYCTTIFMLFAGVTAIFVVTIANVYGRRILNVVWMSEFSC